MAPCPGFRFPTGPASGRESDPVGLRRESHNQSATATVPATTVTTTLVAQAVEEKEPEYVPTPLNVLFLMSDQHRADAVGRMASLFGQRHFRAQTPYAPWFTVGFLWFCGE